MSVVSDSHKKYIYNLIDSLFRIREETCDGFISSSSKLDSLSEQALNIVFEILWNEAHWAIRNKLGVPRGKIHPWTEDEERLFLIRWLMLFSDSSFLHPNAIPLQKISKEGARLLTNIRLGKRHRYDRVAGKGEKGLADAKKTTFHRILKEINILIREGIPERQARGLARKACNMEPPLFSKWTAKILGLYIGDSNLIYMSREKGGRKGEPREPEPLIPNPTSISRKDIRKSVNEHIQPKSPQTSSNDEHITTIKESVIRLLEAATDWREFNTSPDVAENAATAKRRNKNTKTENNLNN